MRIGSRYLLVGIWNSLFGISNFYFLSIIFNTWPDLVVLGCSYLISIVQAHVAQRKFVWQSKSAYFPELARFSSAYILQFSINSALLVHSDMWLSVNRETRQTVIVIFLTIVFYFVNKRGVFRVTK
jgi:putative flippase GtrA